MSLITIFDARARDTAVQALTDWFQRNNLRLTKTNDVATMPMDSDIYAAMDAAIAALDKARSLGSEKVVERLNQLAQVSRQREYLSSSDLEKIAADAVVIITTLQAMVADLEVNQRQIRKLALKEALDVADRWGRNGRSATACGITEDILALIDGGPHGQ